MKIVIAGGTGFLGQELEKYFTEKNHNILILSRKSTRANDIKWDARTLGQWAKTLEGANVLINLTGKSVDCRYTEANKKAIVASRLESTQVLQKAIDLCQNPPKIWLNASSATIYVHAENQLMTEVKGIIGDDFSMNVCQSWERVFFEKPTPNTRKVALRTSIVLGNGGALPKMKTITRLGLGGKQGRGTQYMSWIHIQDFCKAVEYIIETEHIAGVINVTAPEPIDNQSFMSLLRKHIGIPFGIQSPTFLLEFAAIFIRTETELLLKSRYVYPQILIESGFEFKYPTAGLALKSL
jgi:uncharacterized protein